MIGSRVTSQLKNLGHEVIVGARSAGIDIITGEGLTTAMAGTDVVIDLSNSVSPEEETAIRFFHTAGENLVAAEKMTGIKHHIVLSIVGIDRVLHIGYLRAKKAQEDLIKSSGLPYTIIRSTQFHEHITTIMAVQGAGNDIHVSTMDYQPIAVEDVVNYITRVALAPPQNGTVEIAGPEKGPMNEFVSRYLTLKNRAERVIPNDDNRYMSFIFPKTALVPEGHFIAGLVKFDDWAKN